MAFLVDNIAPVTLSINGVLVFGGSDTAITPGVNFTWYTANFTWS